MRRRLSLALLAVLVVLAVVVSSRHLWPGGRPAIGAASAGARGDSLARLDSVASADSQPVTDTSCFASRLGLPCDPR